MYRYLWGSLLTSLPVVQLLEPSLHSKATLFIEHLLLRYCSKLRGQKKPKNKKTLSLDPHPHATCKWEETNDKKYLL